MFIPAQMWCSFIGAKEASSQSIRKGLLWTPPKSSVFVSITRAQQEDKQYSCEPLSKIFKALHNETLVDQQKLPDQSVS